MTVIPGVLPPVSQLLDRALTGHDLSPAEGETLLQVQDGGAIAEIRAAADDLRRHLVGETVTYVVNRNINFTNICEQHCNFCAFRRDEGDEGAYWLDIEQMLGKAQAAIDQGATELCIQGGLNPQAKHPQAKHPQAKHPHAQHSPAHGTSLGYYTHLIQTLHHAFPSLHLHAFSPQEVQFIAREDGLDYATVLDRLQEAGVGSLPGTAAEVLDDTVRRVICPEKINSATWLEIVSTAHRLGFKTTSTLLSGHIETPAQQIQHLDQLRSLQQTAQTRNYPGGITEFILLPFVGEHAPQPLRKRVGRDQPSLAAALHLMAVARLYLGRWILNHQPSWVKLGLGGATEALTWGCNDIGGTLMEEHITSMAGAKGGTCQTVEALRGAIARLQRPAQQRDTLYRAIE